MTTRIGVIAEGPIDHVLLESLIPRIAADKAAFAWPMGTEDVADLFPIRKRGHGGVPDAVRQLVTVLKKTQSQYSFFVILLDRRTRAVQTKIRRLIRGRTDFVLAVAIEEIEAWWLGDRTNTLLWSGLSNSLRPDARYAKRKYKAEKDPAPKKTLDELTRLSDRFDRYYGDGNLDLASDFAENYWKDHARLDEIVAQCQKGFGPFQREMANRFQQVKARAGSLV